MDYALLARVNAVNAANALLALARPAREAQRRYAEAIAARRALGVDSSTLRIMHRAHMVMTARPKGCQRRARPRTSHAVRRRAGASARTAGCDPPSDDDPERTASAARIGGVR
jgi:hypothetical protein